ncbi:aspartyl protease family protein [Sphingomonas sp. ASY06-1R]|uniref:aspartyl protease family protein n=1 Tax=Sphingomonas sp. ASY06-1R TaxID=3445771 RepID=UPI003FA1E8F7
MKVSLLFATALMGCGVAQATFAQSAPGQDAEAPIAGSSDRPTLASSKPTTIPFALRDNLVVMDASLNGRTQSAVLDSGASALIIDRRKATALGLNEGQSTGDAAGAGPQAQQLRPVHVASLSVGPLRFANLPGQSSDLQQLSTSAGFPVDVLIGAPAFKYGAVQVDYRRQRVTFGPTGSMGKCANPIPLTIVYDVPVVDVEIRPTATSQPVRLKLVVDLGTRHRAVMIGGPFARSEMGKALIASGKIQPIGHGIGGQVQGGLARIAEFRLGGQRISGLEVALSSGVAAFETGLIDGSLGVPLWKSGRIRFDYPAQTLCIET